MTTTYKQSADASQGLERQQFRYCLLDWQVHCPTSEQVMTH